MVLLPLQDYRCVLALARGSLAILSRRLLNLTLCLKVMRVLMLQETCPSSLAVSTTSRQKILRL